MTLPSKKKTGRTLAEIDAEMAALAAEREAVQAAEKQDVIARIRHAIEHYGLNAGDLGLAGRPSGKAKAMRNEAPPAKRAKKLQKPVASPSPPKYSDGADKTWTGHGKRPAWFVEALAAGKTAEDLLIKPTQ